jgi:hypothetical protein
MKITDILEATASPIDYSVFIKPNMTEKEQMFVLSKKGQLLKDILKAGNIPSEKVQLFIVKRKKNGLAALIRGKITPSENVIYHGICYRAGELDRVIKAGIPLSEQLQLHLITTFDNTSAWIIRKILQYNNYKPSHSILKAIIEHTISNIWTFHLVLADIVTHNIPVPKDVLNIILTDETIIKFNKFLIYDDFVRHYFKDNTVLMNKWLRYAENIRSMS